MAKILLLALVFVVAFWLLRRYRRHIDREPPRNPAAGTEDMVRCARCDIHIPRGEGVTAEGRYFCSAEHEREFRNAR